MKIVKHRSFDSGNHRMLVIQYVCCLPMNSVNTCFMLHLFSKYQRYDKYIYAASIGRYLAFGDLFSAIVLSVEIGYPGSKVYCYYFFFIISNGFVNKFLWTQPQWWILFLWDQDQGHIYTVLILVCLSFCLSFCLWLPANFWAIENVEECQDFIWWIMKKNGRESSRLLINFKVKLNTKTWTSHCNRCGHTLNIL